MGEGEGDDLPGIGWIGEDLLIAGHRGIEADLADGMSGGAEPDSFQHRAVREHEQGGGFWLRPSVGWIVLCLGHGLLVAYYVLDGKDVLCMFSTHPNQPP
jgi:hypothetical protein